MAVVREQFAVESALVSIANGNDGVFTLTRPAEPAEGNTIDWVARKPVRKEFHQGKAFIAGNAVIAVAGASLRKVEILDALGAVLRTVLDVADDAFLMNGATTTDLLKSMLLREDERSIRLTVHNLSGGALNNSQFVCRFDFGLNAANYSSSPAVL